MKGIKILLIVIGISFGLVLLVFGGGMFYLQNGQKEVNNLEIKSIDLSTIEDGTYIGEYKGYRWSNQVEVIVQNHQIIEIKLIKDQTFNKSEVSEELFAKVQLEQNLDVDAISGATVSSKAYLKAIEDALSN